MFDIQRIEIGHDSVKSYEALNESLHKVNELLNKGYKIIKINDVYSKGGEMEDNQWGYTIYHLLKEIKEGETL